MTTYTAGNACNISKLEIQMPRDNQVEYEQGQLVVVTLNTVLCKVTSVSDTKIEIKAADGGHVFPTLSVMEVPEGE